MRGRWLRFAERLGFGVADAEVVWLGLVAAYEADGRFYHNLTHIEHALNIADQLQEVAADFTAVQLAIWFHDVVYDPRQSDNEAQSVAYVQRVLHPLNVPEKMLTTVSNLILATKNHETATSAGSVQAVNSTNSNYFVMLDADLAILGASPERYAQYAHAIRQEYSFVPDAAYQAGRTAVLHRFLERSPFYFTDWMRDWGETAVVQNLSQELKFLQ
ncbi:MAG: hypothetical protein GY805_15070 [Chloroflexi bacterium]|nr:hypothetical protein [Chloroflexota bacterium]